MRDKSKTLHGRDAGLQGMQTIRAEYPQLQYNNPTELIQDCQKLEREVQHYRSVTPEPRACVYRISSSVPFSRGRR